MEWDRAKRRPALLLRQDSDSQVMARSKDERRARIKHIGQKSTLLLENESSQRGQFVPNSISEFWGHCGPQKRRWQTKTQNDLIEGEIRSRED